MATVAVVAPVIMAPVVAFTTMVSASALVTAVIVVVIVCHEKPDPDEPGADQRQPNCLVGVVSAAGQQERRSHGKHQNGLGAHWDPPCSAFPSMNTNHAIFFPKIAF